MKKNWKYVLLLGTLCLTACMEKPDVPANGPTAVPTQETVAPEVTETTCATTAPEVTTVPEGTESPDTTTVPEVPKATTAPEAVAETVPVRILLENKRIVEWEDERQLYAVIWQNPLMGGEDAAKYPAVSTVFRSLKTLRDKKSEEVVTNLANTAEELKQYADETDVSCYDSTGYFVQRADNHIISMQCNWNVNTGSIHPSNVVTGENFSTETGAMISLSEVVTDVEKIRALVKQTLSEKYADCLFEEWESLYDETETDNLAWTMDYDGLTFYFSPYELSFYAAGVLTAEIDFAEEPALFRDIYMTAPEQGWASAVPFHSFMELDGVNGTKDTFLIGLSKAEWDDFYHKLEIGKNGRNILEYEMYAYEYKTYLATVADKYYLFVEETTENDYKILYIFDLSLDCITEPMVQINAGFVTMRTDAEDYSYGEEVFNNPAEIYLSSRLDVFRTMSGTRRYSFDAKAGMLVPLTNLYTLDETQTPLVSKIPLEVSVLGENTSTIVPAGTEFTFLRSDGATYVEFRLPDGRECRVTREDGDGWPYTVNGVPEEECFDGIGYAG